jgi:hypothetical protein
VIAGIGAASLVTAGVFEAQVSSEKNDSATIGNGLSPSACSGNTVPSDCASLTNARAAQARDQDLANGFLVGGVAAIAVGAALFFWPDAPTPKRVTLVPSFTASSAGLQLRGEL